MAIYDANEFSSIVEISEGLRRSRDISRVVGPLIKFFRILGDGAVIALLPDTRKQRTQGLDCSRCIVVA
jgi:hypothetical protein